MTKQELLDYCRKFGKRAEEKKQCLDKPSHSLFYAGESLAYQDIAKILDEDLNPEKYVPKGRTE